MRVKKKTYQLPKMNSESLKEFRQAAYELMVKAKDATFELMDAVMTTRNAGCLADFSLSPWFRREWSSTYEALQDNGLVVGNPPFKKQHGNCNKYASI